MDTASRLSKLLEDSNLPVRPPGVMIAFSREDEIKLAKGPCRVELVCLDCNSATAKTTVEISDGSPLSFDILDPKPIDNKLTCIECGNSYLERYAYRVL
jgi:hypothetical protein